MNNSTKKSLGQHWLRDESILEAIVEAADVRSGDQVLEIGPGLGTLTEVLVEKGAQVTALEYDQDLIPNLKKSARALNFHIIEGDVRTFDFGSMPENYKIVANIPYYLTSNLIRAISETDNQPDVTALLVQKEVAERICAVPGYMGILSVVAQFYFVCSLDVEVPAEYFDPPPKVDSQVIVLKRREVPLFTVDDKAFFRLVKAGFSEKRKTLRNALSGGLAMDKAIVESVLDKAEIAHTARAQELSLDDWYRLYSSHK